MKRKASLKLLHHLSHDITVKKKLSLTRPISLILTGAGAFNRRRRSSSLHSQPLTIVPLSFWCLRSCFVLLSTSTARFRRAPGFSGKNGLVAKGLELGWGEVVREEWKVWRWLWLGVAHFEYHKHPMSGVRMKLAV
ncbi:hypothetical protein P8452_20346 [Trifolium repens]|nr:hypothetical protein P8452_20346 [Trifolium repens]